MARLLQQHEARSARARRHRFAASYPGSSPYSFLGWSNATGPKLGPGLLAADLYTYLDQVESEVLAVAPDLARFVSEVDASPWVGDEHPTDPWWPK